MHLMCLHQGAEGVIGNDESQQIEGLPYADVLCELSLIGAKLLENPALSCLGPA